MVASICVVEMGHIGLALVTVSDETGLDIVGHDIDDREIRQLEAGTASIDGVDDQLITGVGTDLTALERDRPRTSGLFTQEGS